MVKKEYFKIPENVIRHKKIMKNRNMTSYQTEEFKEQARKRHIEYNKSEEKKLLNQINQTPPSLTWSVIKPIDVPRKSGPRAKQE